MNGINKKDYNIHAGNTVESHDHFKVLDCEHCGFKHVYPMPSQEELMDLYKNDYYQNEKPFYIDRYLEDIEWWNAVYEDRYKFLESNLKKIKNKSILDIGSGPGLFLKLGRERGWKVNGIEPSEQAAKYSIDTLGLDIKKSFLTEDMIDDLGTFNVVNMGEVIEHLPDPAHILEIANKLLKEDGILCLVVPNDFNPFQLILKNHFEYKSWWVSYPHHLNYFSPSSLSKLVSRCGFSILDVHTTFPIDMFLLMEKNYLGNDKLGREIHFLRKNFETNLLKTGKDGSKLLHKLYSSLSGLGLGREIVLYAKKKS